MADVHSVFSCHFFFFSFFFTAAESNYTVNQSLFPSCDVSPTEATSDLSKWTNEAMNHCLSKTDDGERAECILGVLLLLVQAAKVGGRQLDISNCRSIHPSLRRLSLLLVKRLCPESKVSRRIFLTNWPLGLRSQR